LNKQTEERNNQRCCCSAFVFIRTDSLALLFAFTTRYPRFKLKKPAFVFIRTDGLALLFAFTTRYPRFKLKIPSPVKFDSLDYYTAHSAGFKQDI
jgi:hypothetical protein